MPIIMFDKNQDYVVLTVNEVRSTLFAFCAFVVLTLCFEDSAHVFWSG